jgi:hypothetical protein
MGQKRHVVTVVVVSVGVPDLEYLVVDGSIVRLHQHGAAKKTAKTMKPWASRGVG